eukprot:15366794-Ditylum_brightwellii.AAC.1
MVACLFVALPSVIFFLSFQRRDDGNLKSKEKGGGSVFTTVDGVVEATLKRGWSMECLSWGPVVFYGVVADKAVFVFEIRPRDKQNR